MSLNNNFATSYRPRTFAEVVGQEIPKAVLKKIALSPGISCRSIFLKGSYGSGKSTLARIFGRAMSCSHFAETGDVCNECEFCQEASSPNSQLYQEYDATVVGNVDAIRALHDKLSYLPPKGKRRVVVLDEVHACSNSALNALLKMVEEGMPNTIFVFCSTEDILATLKSRSICLDITTVPSVLMKERLKEVAKLESIGLTEAILDAICLKSQGHMRDAMSLLQLYSIAGSEAIKTPVDLIQNFIFSTLKKDKESAESILLELLKFPTVDVISGIATLLKEIYLSDKDSKLNVLLTKGLAPKLFNFFYNPVAQSAMKSEAGLEILLRSFIEKIV